MSLELDEGTTVHCKVVGVHEQGKFPGATPVIEFEVLDEGPHLGVHLTGKPERLLCDWIGTILGYSRSFVQERVRPERILNRPCRVVIGKTKGLRQRLIVRDVLPI